MPPTPYCPSCRSDQIDWTSVTGRGTLYSYTIIQHTPLPDYQGSVPYAAGVISLDDVPIRMVSALICPDSDDLKIGAAFEVEWVPISEGNYPLFRICT